MAMQNRIMDEDHLPTLYSFVLVGMKYNGATARDALAYDKIVLVADPENAVDPNAIKVLGWEHASELRMLGHISMDTQPMEGIHGKVPLHGTEGTIYKVYSSRARGQSVEMQIYLNHVSRYP